MEEAYSCIGRSRRGERNGGYVGSGRRLTRVERAGFEAGKEDIQCVGLHERSIQEREAPCGVAGGGTTMAVLDLLRWAGAGAADCARGCR